MSNRNAVDVPISADGRNEASYLEGKGWTRDEKWGIPYVWRHPVHGDGKLWTLRGALGIQLTHDISAARIEAPSQDE